MRLNRFQEEFVQDVVYNEDLSVFGVCGGKGCAKTWAEAIAARLYIEEYGVPITWTVDTIPRIHDVVDPVLKKVMPRKGWRRRIVHGRVEYEHTNGGILKTSPYYCEDSEDPSSSNQEGISVALYMTDEMHLIEPICFDTALQRARDRVPDPVTGELREARLVFCGPPVYPDYWMKRCAELPGSKLYRVTSQVNVEILGELWLQRLIAGLTPRQYQQSILGIITPPEGQVLSDWSTDPWPNGNTWDAGPDWIQATNGSYTVLALDFGRRSPAALLIRKVMVPHPVTGAMQRVDVIIHEMQLDGLTTDQAVAELLRHCWPRVHGRHDKAKGKILFDKLVVDPSGVQKSQLETASGAQSNFQLVARHPDQGGLGLQPRFNQADGKASVSAGLTCLQRTILRGVESGHPVRTLTCLRSVWQRGMGSLDKGRSWARCVLKAEYDGDVHQKDDKTDHGIDAACYWAKEEHWQDGAMEPGAYGQAGGASPVASYYGDR